MKKTSAHSPEVASSHPLFCVRSDLSMEVLLSNASEILETAAVTGHEAAQHMQGVHREQLMTMIQSIELTQVLIDEALVRECPVTS